MKKKFFKAVLPSMMAFAFSGLYSIVDGLFIGRNIGDMGLAAINFAYPLVVFIQAAGTGIGMGGAVWISIAKGKEEAHEERHFLGNTLSCLAAAALLITVLMTLFSGTLLGWLGAGGEVFELSSQYMLIIALGAAFQIIATGLTPLLRNYEQAVPAMAAMIGGFLTNIVLDWLFVAVLQYGMAGAAWATIIGQAVTCIPCIICISNRVRMLPRHLFIPVKAKLKRILATGISPFGLSMSPYIVVILMNIGALRQGGPEGVAAYAVISYVSSCMQLILQGIGDGSQPLMSYLYGQGRHEAVKIVRKYAYILAALLAITATGVFILLRSVIPVVFGSSAAVIALVERGLPLYAAGFILTAFLRITTSYFYATKRDFSAYCIIFSEPVIIFLLLFYLLTPMGLTGVWLTVPLAQLLLSGAGFIQLKRKSGSSHRQ